MDGSDQKARQKTWERGRRGSVFLISDHYHLSVKFIYRINI